MSISIRAMATTNAFDVLEVLLGESLPPELSKILVESGYDTLLSLQSLDSEAICDIENFVNTNRSITKHTSYENQGNFRLKPGHRLFLLRLAEKIRSKNLGENIHIAEKNQSPVFSYILKKLIETAQTNSAKDPKRYRYSEELRYFATYIYIMCGKSCYEVLSANLPLPKVTSVLGYVNEYKTKIIEGELRCQELLHYLEMMKVKKCVWLSEDASGIIAKVEFDPKTNQMVGIVLPMNASTGMPIPFTYLSRTIDEIEANMKKDTSSLVYIVMAQPLQTGIPPFVLQIFGTNNKFNSQHVLNRWKFTVAELKRHGINVVGFSSDGDTRLLQSMRLNSKFDTKVQINDWFGETDINICYMQDVVHIGTKLRNRLLNQTNTLLIGTKIATVAHLKVLLNSVSKDDHGLIYSDICPEDRQNFDSLKKIMHPRVTSMLAQHVVDSEGTVEYIRICHQITSSLYEENIPPSERILRLWRSTFFLRAWRMSITSSSVGSGGLNENFITQNAYACIELNARNLLLLIQKLRDENLAECFTITLCNSQPCEETFRQMRSMGTINYTKINFTLLQLIHIVGRVELLNNIMHLKLRQFDIKFPRSKLNLTNSNKFSLPTNDEIKRVIDKALGEAITDAKKFGIIITAKDIEQCSLQDVRLTLQNTHAMDSNIGINLGIGSERTTNITCESLRDYSDDDKNLGENSSYIEVLGPKKRKVVAKSSIIWLLSDSKKKLSSDRLKRVQEYSGTLKKPARQSEFIDVTQTNQLILHAKKIRTGDWCIFQNKSNDDKLLLGCVLSFRYINGTTKKEKQYSLDFAPTIHATEARGVEVLASWNLMEKNGTIDSGNKQNSYINIKLYVGTISKQLIERNEVNGICIKKDKMSIIENELFHLKTFI